MYYSEKTSQIIIMVILTMLVVSAWWAYGSPLPLIKYLIKGDEIAWKAVGIIFGYIVVGFGVVFLYTLFYDKFLDDEKDAPASKKNK